MNKLPKESTATPKGRSSLALVAAPPSPETPDAPLPATVTMLPDGDTMRTQLFWLSAT